MHVHYKTRLDKALAICRKRWPYNGNKPIGYHHHHITPRSWGGSDTSDNLVTVPHRIHYILHMLMAKAYPNDDRMAYAWLVMYNTSGTSRIYERLRDQCERAIRHAFANGLRISPRAGKVMARNTVSGDVQLIDKQLFDQSSDWVGISTGITRTDEFKRAVGARSSSATRNQKQRDAARANIASQKVLTCCLCCHKVRTYPNHIKHINNISHNKGKPRSAAQTAAVLEGKRRVNETNGTLRKTHVVVVDGIKYLCWDIVQLCRTMGISAPTARKRYEVKFIGVYNRNGVIQGMLPEEHRSLEWFIAPPARMQ